MRELKWTSKFKKKYKDHGLVGELKDFRECHLTPDWLLVYFKSENTDSGVKTLILTLVDTGFYSDLFK